MSKHIHKPSLIRSNAITATGNNITIKIISDREVFVTEEWLKKPDRTWLDAGIITAKKGFKWIIRWELGKNYITTKIINEKSGLVGFYFDITSQVMKVEKHFQAYDWYLDIFKITDKRIVFLDEDELELALNKRYINSEQAQTAKKTAKYILERAKSRQLDF